MKVKHSLAVKKATAEKIEAQLKEARDLAVKKLLQAKGA